MILENIKKENDIKKVPLEDMEQLAQEIREFLLENVSKTGGHLASNLGVVELTMLCTMYFVCQKISYLGRGTSILYA